MSERPADHRGEVCHCDYNPATTQGPEEDCPVHGRPYSYWVEYADEMRQRAERAEAALATAKAEALEEAADAWERGAYTGREYLPPNPYRAARLRGEGE